MKYLGLKQTETWFAVQLRPVAERYLTAVGRLADSRLETYYRKLAKNYVEMLTLGPSWGYLQQSYIA